MIRFLLDHGADINAKLARGTPLCWAAGQGDRRTIELLLAHGADLNKGLHSDRTALDHAFGTRDLDMIRWLVDRGAEMDIAVTGQENLLYAAMTSQRLVDFLIAQGVDVDAADEDGQTPLLYVADSGDAAMARLLIAHGADVNATMAYDETPLHRAAREGSAGMVEVLVNNGADVNAQTTDGLTALDYAIGFEGVRGGREAMTELLRAAGGRTRKELRAAASMQNWADDARD
jgi:ankyrin repeat protein